MGLKTVWSRRCQSVFWIPGTRTVMGIASQSRETPEKNLNSSRIKQTEALLGGVVRAL